MFLSFPFLGCFGLFLQFLSFFSFVYSPSSVLQAQLKPVRVWKFERNSNKQETLFISLKSEFDYGSWGFASHLAFSGSCILQTVIHSGSYITFKFCQGLPLPTEYKIKCFLDLASLLHTWIHLMKQTHCTKTKAGCLRCSPLSFPDRQLCEVFRLFIFLTFLMLRKSNI